MVVLCVLRHVLCADVACQFHDDGAWRAVAKGVKGTSHDTADLVGRVDRFDALYDAPVVHRSREIRTDSDLTQTKATRQNQERDPVRIGLSQPSHRVLRPRL